jgi:phosphoribosyl-ATP pyrophosphohydrolase
VTDVLERLVAVLKRRRRASAAKSYVAGLYAAGTGAILKKIGEEGAELIVAGARRDADALVHETADLWFHTLVLLVHKGVAPRRVLRELERRLGTSGLEEKAARKR